MSNGSLDTSIRPQGSETGLSRKKTKPHQPESQQESGLLSPGLPTNTGHVQQAFMDQHHHQKKPPHHTKTTAVRSYLGPKSSFTNTSVYAVLGNCLIKTCF